MDETALPFRLWSSNCCSLIGLTFPGFIKLSPPIVFPSFSWPFFFFVRLCRRLPTERQDLIHMSHQFIQIPIVFRHCAPPRAMLVVCISQHGLLYANTLSTHTPWCSWMHRFTVCATAFSYLNVATCHLVQTGPSTSSTICLTRRPSAALFHDLSCSIYCIRLLW